MNLKEIWARLKKEPTTVPPWMGNLGMIMSVFGFIGVVFGYMHSNPPAWGVGWTMLFAGGYSWGLSDGWHRALKAMP